MKGIAKLLLMGLVSLLISVFVIGGMAYLAGVAGLYFNYVPSIFIPTETGQFIVGALVVNPATILAKLMIGALIVFHFLVLLILLLLVVACLIWVGVSTNDLIKEFRNED